VDATFKPFLSERINEALGVAFQRTSAETIARLIDVAASIAGDASGAVDANRVKGDGRILFIDPNDIVAVQEEGNYVLLQREAGSHLLRESISVMADKLRPYGFIRIHRSVLVNSAFVREVRPWATGEYRLLLKSGKEYTVTRTYKKNLTRLPLCGLAPMCSALSNECRGSFRCKSCSPDPRFRQKREIPFVGAGHGIFLAALHAKHIFPGRPGLNFPDKRRVYQHGSMNPYEPMRRQLSGDV
jgi:hypothetical protein